MVKAFVQDIEIQMKGYAEYIPTIITSNSFDHYMVITDATKSSDYSFWSQMQAMSLRSVALCSHDKTAC